MALLEDIARKLAEDTFAQAVANGDEALIEDVSKAVGATSNTLQEAFLTAIRYLRADARARELLARRAGSG